MIRRIYKFISIILINSILLSNFCSVCRAKDFTFAKSNIEPNIIIDIPDSGVPTTNVDIYSRVELPSSDNVLTTPSEDVIGNKIVSDIFKAKENSIQISCTSSKDSAKVDYNGEKRSVYRGGNDFKENLDNGEVKYDDKINDIINSKRGPSVNIDPSKVKKFGGAYEIKSIPDELQIIQQGKDLGHYEITPKESMSMQHFKDLLDQIELSKVD